jgi:membrane-associated phospholipid phosphatase
LNVLMASDRVQLRFVLLAGSLVPPWAAMLLLGASAVDRDVLLALYAREEPWLALAALGVTYLGDWWTVGAVTLLGASWLLYQGKRWAALTLLIASFAGRALVAVQKFYFARLRPEENLGMVEVSSLSFPSGHAANSTIAYLTLALLLFDDPRQRRIAAAFAIALAFLIGLSRPMLGVHWPSDVVGGWAFGLLWVGLVVTLMQRWRPDVRR